jgi:hypothetical protein
MANFPGFYRRVVEIAKGIWFDNSTSDLISENVQDAIEEINDKIFESSSPGFAFGRNGNISSNTWMQQNDVPSNRTGIPVYLDDPVLDAVSIANENASTFSVEIYEHDGSTFTLLHTVAVAAARTERDIGINVPVTVGKELAVKVVSGSAKNLVVILQLKGAS